MRVLDNEKKREKKASIFWNKTLQKTIKADKWICGVEIFIVGLSFENFDAKSIKFPSSTPSCHGNFSNRRNKYTITLRIHMEITSSLTVENRNQIRRDADGG